MENDNSSALFDLKKSMRSLKKHSVQSTEETMEECADKFYRGMIDFINSLLSVLPGETQLIVAKVHIQTQLSKDKLIKKFVKKIMPVSEFIEQRKEIFFIEGQYLDTIFNKSALFKFDFRSIWNQLDVANKSMLWDWMDKFCKLAKTWDDGRAQLRTISRGDGTLSPQPPSRRRWVG